MGQKNNYISFCLSVEEAKLLDLNYLELISYNEFGFCKIE